MKNINELIEQLPSNWSELKLKDYQKLVDVDITETTDDGAELVGVENSIKVLSVLLDVPVDDLESMPLQHLGKLSQKIAFINEPPQPLKTSRIKWKKPDEISYNDFVKFQQVQDKPVQNLSEIIKAFAKNELTDEEVLDLGMDEVNTGFFLLRKELRQFTSNMKMHLVRKLIQKVAHQKWMKVKQVFSRKTKR